MTRNALSWKFAGTGADARDVASGDNGDECAQPPGMWTSLSLYLRGGNMESSRLQDPGRIEYSNVNDDRNCASDIFKVIFIAF